MIYSVKEKIALLKQIIEELQSDEECIEKLVQLLYIQWNLLIWTLENADTCIKWSAMCGPNIISLLHVHI